MASLRIKSHCSISLFDHVTRAGDDVYDKALLTLGPVCNVGINETGTPDDNIILLRLTFTVMEHVSFEIGAKNWASIGIMFQPTRMWVGQLAVYALEDAPLAYDPAVSGKNPSQNQLQQRIEMTRVIFYFSGPGSNLRGCLACG